MTELKLQQCRLDGRYDIQDCLGRGSYAEIYVARDLAAADGEPQMVVIKALNVLLQGAIDTELERTLVGNFQNEAIALDRVRHPNVISRLGHGTAIDLSGITFHYLVLEYLSGGDMAAMCSQQPLSIERALFYLAQVCAGLAHAHAGGVIHRDIKPHNLLLTDDKRIVKIADFGVAKLGATEGAITRVGTNIYAAPEHNPLVHTGQLDSAALSAVPRQLTPAADVYSLAKTTYTLLAGEPPRRFSQRPITELPAHIAGASWAPSVLRVLQRATQTRAGERYQTVQEFWAELVDATLPPTQLLDNSNPKAESARPDSGLPRSTGPSAVAPPRPKFDTARDLNRSRMEARVDVRPRIVVPVATTGLHQTPAQQTVRQQAREIEAPEISLPRRDGQAPGTTAAAGRVKRLAVAMGLIVAFAGMLLATHTYIQSRRSASAKSPPAASNSTDVGRVGVTTVDVNLRPDPSTSNYPVGVAEQGSRVRVLNINSNWYEVQVLQHGRDKDNPDSADRGWIHKRFVRFD